MERLSLAFVLLSRAATVRRRFDGSSCPVARPTDALGLQRTTAAPLLQEQLLDPLEKCLPEWSEYARGELDADAALELELVQNLLSRVRTIAASFRV